MFRHRKNEHRTLAHSQYKKAMLSARDGLFHLDFPSFKYNERKTDQLIYVYLDRWAQWSDVSSRKLSFSLETQFNYLQLILLLCFEKRELYQFYSQSPLKMYVFLLLVIQKSLSTIVNVFFEDFSCREEKCHINKHDWKVISNSRSLKCIDLNSTLKTKLVFWKSLTPLGEVNL